MSFLTLDIERPAAGGRMLARHEGRIVLVSGAIPGERVTARLERTEKGVTFAEAIDVVSSSADRRPVAGDARCGGNVFAHITYPRQLELKGQIIQDGFRRIGHVAIDVPAVTGSPERGYRMRARFHVQQGKVGFYLEGTHQLCDAAATGQLLPASCEWLARAQETIASHGLDITAIELAENVAGDERAAHLEGGSGGGHRYSALAEGLVGLSLLRSGDRDVVTLAGRPSVNETIRVADEPARVLTIGRDVRSFFQGNRFLLEPLVRQVAALVPPGPVIDLYAGVGLFGLAMATIRTDSVTIVEGDPVSGADLQRNVMPFAGRVRVVGSSVERFLSASRNRSADAAVIVDPPRTGLSRDALAGLIRLGPGRLVYVSCDVATLARDARALIAAGYALTHVSGIDLFPNTAHVESIAAFTR